MMPIEVQFPDGIRSVPSVDRLIKSREIPPRDPTVMKEPAYDPEWEFTAVIGGWRATRRN